MSRLDLRQSLSPGLLPTFDYAAIRDPETERQLRDAAVRVRELQRAAVVEIGRALLAVKDKLDHGLFLEWIEAEFPFGRRTAVNMMQTATVFGDKWETVSHLPTTILYTLAAPSTPPAVRAAVLNLAPGEAVTPRGVRRAIEALRKADQPKAPRPGAEKREAKRAAEDAAIAARAEKLRKESVAKNNAVTTAADQVRLLLGERFSELVDILEMLNPLGDLAGSDLVLKLKEMGKAEQAERGEGGKR